MIFKGSWEYLEVFNLLTFFDLKNTLMSFTCYDSGVFSYSAKIDSIIKGAELEFSFICDDTLLAHLMMIEILELKEIKYFRMALYINEKLDCQLTWNYQSIGN